MFQSNSFNLRGVGEKADTKDGMNRDRSLEMTDNKHRALHSGAVTELFAGKWGGWKGWQGAGEDGYYACGAEMRFEDNQGGSFWRNKADDTAGNGLRLKYCHINDWNNNQLLVEIYPGLWGDWKGMKMCNEGSYIDGGEVRYEDYDSETEADNTALNGLKIHCRDKTSGTGQWITVYEGIWGGWKGQHVDGSKYVKWAKVQFHDYDGSWSQKLRPEDDTAMNGIRFIMTDPTTDVLVQIHPHCDEPHKSRHSDCVSAASWYCQLRHPYNDGGVSDPLKIGGISQQVMPNAMDVACFPVQTNDHVPLSQLQGYHGNCNDITKSQHADCIAASYRYCFDKGHGGGVPQQVYNGGFDVACFDPSWTGNVDLDTLRQIHPACATVDDSQSPNCVSAINHWCRHAGYGGGISQEIGASYFYVACFETNFYGPINFH